MSANGNREALTLTVELTDAQLDAIAERVAAILRAKQTPPAAGLVDAQAVADALGCSRDLVYARARELGGVRIGDSARPRWRFDLAVARAAWQPVTPPTRSRRRRASANGRELLPVHEEAHHNGKAAL